MTNKLLPQVLYSIGEISNLIAKIQYIILYYSMRVLDTN